MRHHPGPCNLTRRPTSCAFAREAEVPKRELLRTDGQVLWYNPEILPSVSTDLFDIAYQRRQGTLTGSAPGRSKAHFMTLAGHDLVLRPYQRGGLMGKINQSLYLRLGATRSRVWREYGMLGWMHDQGLAVPRPVAGRYAPVGLFYRAQLITMRIPHARPLADLVQEAALPPDVWAGIGRAIGRMHALGVDHSDLNCRNILLDADRKVWLIDFDKCRRRERGAWQDRNLARLKRSLEKERLRHPGLFWSEADWSTLRAGYEARLA